MSDSGCPTINYHDVYANGKVGWILVVQKGEYASGSFKEGPSSVSTWCITSDTHWWFSWHSELLQESNVNQLVVIGSNSASCMDQRKTGMEEAGVLDLYDLHNHFHFTMSRQVEGLETIKKTVMETLGPTAQLSSALLVCVPKASIRRQRRLLPSRHILEVKFLS
ncbi:hypothetical protein SADUNF_Sadunf05G0157800 [Salix dunnii]|uniref:Uncharacterized protein n=1 Tax=Salix dunnii TaxID=1413687 RepID=A0A835K8X5_9ROSI|nr:hypothetical protein SADUNF_Sadunf05G0157800 [Salix dunnii]